MATDASVRPRELLGFDLGGTAAGYWVAVLRVVTGYWFLRAGLGKLLAAEPFDATGWLVNGTQGSPVHGFLAWVGGTPWLMEVVNVAVPVGETLIGLGLLLGALVRLASLFGAFLMVWFYLGNAEWGHGLVNGDLFGLLLFVTLGLLGAGRVLGVDAYLERMEFGRTRAAKAVLG